METRHHPAFCGNTGEAAPTGPFLRASAALRSPLKDVIAGNLSGTDTINTSFTESASIDLDDFVRQHPREASWINKARDWGKSPDDVLAMARTKVARQTRKSTGHSKPHLSTFEADPDDLSSRLAALQAMSNWKARKFVDFNTDPFTVSLKGYFNRIMEPGTSEGVVGHGGAPNPGAGPHPAFFPRQES